MFPISLVEQVTECLDMGHKIASFVVTQAMQCPQKSRGQNVASFMVPGW